jgi:hypothetical protein
MSKTLTAIICGIVAAITLHLVMKKKHHAPLSEQPAQSIVTRVKEQASRVEGNKFDDEQPVTRVIIYRPQGPHEQEYIREMRKSLAIVSVTNVTEHVLQELVRARAKQNWADVPDTKFPDGTPAFRSPDMAGTLSASLKQMIENELNELGFTNRTDLRAAVLEAQIGFSNPPMADYELRGTSEEIELVKKVMQ